VHDEEGGVSTVPVIPNVKPRDFSSGPGKSLKTWNDVANFIWAGHAVFTLLSLKTGMRYTYRIKVKKEDLAHTDPDDINVTYFVEVLRGPDNTDHFSYMGVARRPGRFWITSKSRVLRSSGSAKAFIWFMAALFARRNVLGKLLEVWHEGKCGRCGRRLTVPGSIERGLGDDCASYAEVSK
jgi:hypothetical protein